MTCVVINEELTTENVIKMLISATNDLILLASFNNTSGASAFLSKNTVDLVFLNIQMDASKSYRFIRTIPRETFVIFISVFPAAAVATYRPDAAVASKSARFQKGVDMARIYSGMAGKGNSNIADDYFVL
ncbi:hypothetical protein LL912_00170 [Niabella sp. CC-SYL272]|uniref:hypothetical protein n=1 Tax=Niabella agricola TaxID=2891571 RepID=UPI001F3D8B44|nr:hypothetical protein [Niabella agricola]MCF3107188.1 hypothetical protein [Niabella agricola]